MSLFYSNQKRIADKYCINKNKPKLHCNGKCYLSKKLKQVNQTENTNSQSQDPVSIKIKADPFVLTLINIGKSEQYLTLNRFETYPEIIHSSNISLDIFHPPCHIV